MSDGLGGWVNGASGAGTTDSGRPAETASLCRPGVVADGPSDREGFVQIITDALPVLIAYIDRDRRYRFVNAEYEDWYGLPRQRIIGMKQADVLGPAALAHVEPWVARALSGERVTFEKELAHRRLGLRTIEVTYVPDARADGSVAGFFSLRTDITARKAAERALSRQSEELEAQVAERTRELEASLDQLAQQDRLAAIGTLAAGLGHDIANLLLPMRCRLERLEAATLAKGPAEDVLALRQATDYLGGLARALRQCAQDPGNSQGSTGVTDLGVWWSEVQALLHAAVPRAITLSWTLSPGVRPVAIGQHQLTQAVLNLVINAVDAIPDRGVIEIRASGRAQGKNVELVVTDNGVGMTAAVRRQALSPFFTTKVRGRSTGLGLSMVKSVAESVGGGVKVDSEPGKGTAVRLTLPAAEGSMGAGGRARVAVSIKDDRLAALLVQSIESEHRAAVIVPATGVPASTHVWIVDAQTADPRTARDFLQSTGPRRVILLGDSGPGWDAVGAVRVEESRGIDAIRGVIRAVGGFGDVDHTDQRTGQSAVR